MAEAVFIVRSSSTTDRYQLEAVRTPDGVRFTCTCMGASSGQHCKHRIALARGDVSRVVKFDALAVEVLREMLVGSPIALCLDEMSAAEKALADAQRRLKASKLALAKAFMG